MIDILAEPELFHGYKPKKTVLNQEVELVHELEPIEVAKAEADNIHTNTAIVAISGRATTASDSSSSTRAFASCSESFYVHSYRRRTDSH